MPVTMTHAELFERVVVYEFWMLIETRNALATGVEDRVIRNALIESFCVHARGLVGFFLDRDGAKASEFTDANYAPFKNGRIAQSLLVKINTQIMHITFSRTTDPGKKIGLADREELFTAVVSELSNFLRHAKPEYQALWGLTPWPNPLDAGHPPAASGAASRAATTTST